MVSGYGAWGIKKSLNQIGQLRPKTPVKISKLSGLE